jgi:hypothetical protein
MLTDKGDENFIFRENNTKFSHMKHECDMHLNLEYRFQSFMLPNFSPLGEEEGIHIPRQKCALYRVLFTEDSEMVQDGRGVFTMSVKLRTDIKV